MKKKLVKLTILTMLCIGGLCLLAGCGGKQTTTTSKSDSAEKESKDENTSLPANFAQALTDEDYEEILEMLHLPENSIVSAENIQAFLERSNLQDFLGTDEITAEVTDETDTQIIGNLSIGEGENENCTVIFNRNKENEYVLDMEAAYQEREIKAPGEASIRINGIELNEDWASSAGNEHGTVTYTVFCPVDNFEADVSTAIGDYTVEVEWNEETDKPYDIICHEPDEEVLNNICETLKTNLNNMIADMASGEKDLEKYLSEDAKSGLEDELLSWYSKLDVAEAPVITILEPAADTDPLDEDNRHSIWTNNTIHICTQLENTWNNNGENKNSHIHVQFDLELNQGTYKIIDTDLVDSAWEFTNSFQHDW